MKHRSYVYSFCVFGLLALTLPDASTLLGQEPELFVVDARKYVIESVSDRAKLTLNERSLLNWTNPARQQERGAIYVWEIEGRPLAIGSLFTYEYAGNVFAKHEFHSLSTGPLRSMFDGKLAWTPKSAGIEWRDFKDSPTVGTTRTARLLQMRKLARQFRGELVSPTGEKTELRLLSRPLLEYSSPKLGIVEGAIFSFAVATDPEVLLLVEAFDSETNGTRHTGYRHAFARFHYWQVAVYDGEKMIWDAPLDDTHATNPLGDKKNIEKPYNSYQPRSGPEE